MSEVLDKLREQLLEAKHRVAVLAQACMEKQMVEEREELLPYRDAAILMHDLFCYYVPCSWGTESPSSGLLVWDSGEHNEWLYATQGTCQALGLSPFELHKMLTALAELREREPKLIHVIRSVI